jgi:hypothetical protein
MKKAPCRAAFQGTHVPVLMLRADCSLVALNSAHSSCLLPQTERQVHRLKLIKRQSYGRAGFDLFRHRVLARSA